MKISAHLIAAGLASFLSACGALRPADVPAPALYRLDVPAATAPVSSGQIPRRSLNISTPQALAGFDSPRMIYQREPLRVEYFADSQWVDTPARMLAPLIAQAVAPAFDVTPTGQAELRLDTQIVQLQQDFRSQPSQLRLTLRVSLVDQKTQRLLGSTLLEAKVGAGSDDARGGVAAANKAVQTVLDDLGRFVLQASQGLAR